MLLFFCRDGTMAMIGRPSLFRQDLGSQIEQHEPDERAKSLLIAKLRPGSRYRSNGCSASASLDRKDNYKAPMGKGKVMTTKIPVCAPTEHMFVDFNPATGKPLARRYCTACGTEEDIKPAAETAEESAPAPQPQPAS